MGVAVASLILFALNQNTAVPRGWGIAAGQRYDVPSWISMLIQILVLPIGAAVLGFFIVRKQGRMGWLLMLMGFFSVLNIFVLEATVYLNYTVAQAGELKYWVAWVGNWIWLPAMVLMILLLSFFPNGRFYTRRWGWAISIAAGVMAISLLTVTVIDQPLSSAFSVKNPLIEEYPERLYNILFSIGVLAMPLAAVLALTSTVLRFRYSSGRERQQMKWLLVGVGVAAFQIVFGSILVLAFDSIWGELLVNHAAIGLLIGIGVALIRYNLYDIDLIIRRTLVYSLVSAVLAATYFLSVILIQRLTTWLTGEQSAVAVVLSTLLIAALFNPLRGRIQATVDKRFYRSKYNAQQTLARFAATARDEVDLEKLSAALTAVIQETMQPKTVSLWLRPTASKRSR